MNDIPPIFCDPEPGKPPPLSAFRKLPAERIAPGDLLLLGGCIYRVRAVQTHGSTPRRTFTLCIFTGGRISSETYWSREWLPVVRA